MALQQGQIFIIHETPWILVDGFHNNADRYPSVHCAPIIANSDLKLELDVPLAFEGGYASLGLMRKHSKKALGYPASIAHAREVEEIRRNLITWFSVYSFDFDTVRRLPPPPDQPVTIYPGMIFKRPEGPVCIVDHWACFNDYPLLYVAHVTPELPDLCPLDVEISSEFRDLFSDRYFVRTDDLFLIPRDQLETVSDLRIQMLGYGLVRKMTRALILKFGHLTLLL